MATTASHDALIGPRVRLEPLSLDHLDGLWKAWGDGRHAPWLPFPPHSREEMRSSILEALTELERGSALPYATQADGQVVGSTRFGNISRKDRRYEIGWTWLAPRWQRTFVNTETKWLMLNHAFEVLNALRVELKTDALNLQSRNAILRLGATEEGTFRKHLITATGRVRDTVYFSIVADEWPRIKAQLKRRLDSNPADRS